MDGHSITTSHDNSPGVYASLGGAVVLNGVAIRMNGSSSPGLRSNGSGSSITMTGGSVTVNAADMNGAVAALVGSTISLTGVSVASAGGPGCVSSAGGTLVLTNSSVRSVGVNSWALWADGASSVINATVNGQDIAGESGLIVAANGGAVNLTAAGASRLYGVTESSWGVGSAINLAIGGDAVWTVPGDSNLTTLALNGGRVVSVGPYKELYVYGNLAGGGGIFNLNANLSAGLSDLVRIGGTAAGSHRVFVTVLGGVPADRYRAVKIVDLNEGAAHTATFTGGADVGAYRYGVARGAAIPAGYSGVASLADYYLYNTFGLSTPASAAVSSAAAPGIAWYGEMNDIKKRLGELRLGKTAANDFWARTYAGKYKVKPDGGQPFDQLARGFEIGKDRLSAVNGGRRYFGWVAGVGRADNTFAAGGSGDTDSFYLGAYGSWLRDDGSYVDIVGKHNWFRNRFTAPVLGGGSDSAAYRNKGFGLSVETGKRFERGGGVFFEPQAELAALWSQGGNYTTANGLAVRAPAVTSLQMRIGAVFGKKTAVAGGGSREVYGKLSWVQELAGRYRTVIDDVSQDSSLRGGRLVAGLGFMEDTDKRQLYLDVETAWGKRTDKPWGVNLGCRWKF